MKYVKTPKICRRYIIVDKALTLHYSVQFKTHTLLLLRWAVIYPWNSCLLATPETFLTALLKEPPRLPGGWVPLLAASLGGPVDSEHHRLLLLWNLQQPPNVILSSKGARSLIIQLLVPKPEHSFKHLSEITI